MGGKKMKHKIKVTVIDKKLYPELRQQYCADPNTGVCSCYNVGDEFIFYRDDERDDFWNMGCYFSLYLHRFAGWFYYERLVERRKYDDYLLF